MTANTHSRDPAYNLAEAERDIINLTTGGTPEGELDAVGRRLLTLLHDMAAQIDMLLEVTTLKEAAEAMEEL